LGLVHVLAVRADHAAVRADDRDVRVGREHDRVLVRVHPSGGSWSSFVMSVNDTPASVERITARPFERPLPPKTGSSS